MVQMLCSRNCAVWRPVIGEGNEKTHLVALLLSGKVLISPVSPSCTRRVMFVCGLPDCHKDRDRQEKNEK